MCNKKAKLITSAIVLWCMALSSAGSAALANSQVPHLKETSPNMTATENACAAQSKSIYLACFNQQDCDAHPLPEASRSACDACWQTYRTTTENCAPAVTVEKTKEKPPAVSH